MSIFNRIRDLLSANVNSMLDSAEDPEKMLSQKWDKNGLQKKNCRVQAGKNSNAATMW